jgi:septum formation protein
VAPIAPRLVLASGSKARLRVLRDAGFDPEVAVSGVDETVEELTTAEAVIVIAERKATAMAPQFEHALVLGCDSLLELDGMSLGKPKSETEVLDVWRRLSGRQARLFTGHCLIETGSGRSVREVAGTLIRFGNPTREEITAYAGSAEPFDLAGAFSIEGRGGPFVEGIDGSPTNVLGLSLPHFRELLARVGIQISELWRNEWP